MERNFKIKAHQFQSKKKILNLICPEDNNIDELINFYLN